MQIKKFDIVNANLNPKKGHTQSGIRPCVVVQSNVFNKYGSTVLLVPLTTTIKDIFPSEFWILASNENGLIKKSRFLGSQIITLDKEYVLNIIGKLEKQYYKQVKNAIEISLDLNNDY